ncbi:hypothetical protein QYM36_002037 [Artemia franciscana]|uniref:Uncharacterized protein n=1 Tax=Artemia franciscana TaxID=6661 RepID=A0AA88I909_ARTSF|nr:hypothetical protein QYM36_002037 [Artemia franciscana]
MENSQSLPAMHQLTKRMKRERHETLQSVVAEFPRHDIICVVGDLNAKVGSCHNYCPEVMGKHGIGDMNENGALLVDFALNNDLVIGGILAHNAYQYYSGFHPYKVEGAHVPFDQRDPGCFPLVSELATIALTYYQGRTIANSPSLRTADASSEDASVSALWKTISLMRKSAPRDIIMTYYGAMKGQDVAQVLGKVIEADDANFDTEKT